MKKSRELYISVERNITFIYGSYRIGTKREWYAYMNWSVEKKKLVEDIPRLRKYFKTKFRNRILDYLRKQESQKRRYDKEAYEEVGEISHRISEGGLWLDDYYLFHETLRDYRSKQTKEQQEELERVLRNERFRGRQRVLRDLRIVFKEFDIRAH